MLAKKRMDMIGKVMPKKKSGKLAVFAAFFAGVAIGFIISPAKNGFGYNNGNTTHYHYNGDGEPKPECECGDVGDCDKEEEV